MGDASTEGGDEERRTGDADRRDDGRANRAEAVRPSTAGGPPTDGEVAARRLIVGHLDTSDLDPVTAKAVELLAAADMVAAEHYQPHAPRLWREPMWLMSFAVMTVLLVVAVALLLIVRRTDESTAQRDRIQQVSEQIKDCVEPAGKCAQRGNAQTAAAIVQLIRANTIAVECADAYNGTDAIDACIARRYGPAGR